ncbi:MAG TPA: uroporphyrinogen-III C-methyltransferase [Candidatus Saccharimonadales bacterium]|jgi:uroporphyrin-III C-methyltransferase|nr:uroporphyrinogen-III C-methyltransferase [Candidatus Saccharimonadales bacterium]
MTGKVYIVGAGPGAADLLTVKAASVLARAGVVLYDDLVSAEVLALACPAAETINVGKRCGHHGAGQDQINRLMVQHARRGQLVVRLKSGDPAVFGRLGEELHALREEGIPFEIVPGVTAVTAAAAAASATLTDRRMASSLVVLTGHRCTPAASLPLLSDSEQTTYAIYMPGPDYSATARDLLRAGLDAETPCALVSNAGRSQQQVYRLRLGQLHSHPSVPAPAVLIVGRVMAVEENIKNAAVAVPLHIPETGDAGLHLQSLAD